MYKVVRETVMEKATWSPKGREEESHAALGEIVFQGDGIHKTLKLKHA